MDGKRETTRGVPPQTKRDAYQRWKQWWKDLSQERLQGWIKRIMENIPVIIALEGDNNFQEARMIKKSRPIARTSPVSNADEEWQSDQVSDGEEYVDSRGGYGGR